MNWGALQSQAMQDRSCAGQPIGEIREGAATWCRHRKNIIITNRFSWHSDSDRFGVRFSSSDSDCFRAWRFGSMSGVAIRIAFGRGDMDRFRTRRYGSLSDVAMWIAHCSHSSRDHQTVNLDHLVNFMLILVNSVNS